MNGDALSHDVLIAARSLWNWLPVIDRVTPADLLFILGNKADSLPIEAARLYAEHLAPVVVVSGGYGRLTTGHARTEADRYFAALVAQGVPKGAIILEDRSTNTGQNIVFTKELLGDRGMRCTTGIAVTTAMMSRRHQATLRKLWPEIEWQIATPPPKPFDRRLAEDDVNEFFNLMVGEVDRLERYPQRGFIDAVNIPKDIAHAKTTLSRAGYTAFLVPE